MTYSCDLDQPREGINFATVFVQIKIDVRFPILFPRPLPVISIDSSLDDCSVIRQ